MKEFKTYKNYNSVPKEYKWDLEVILGESTIDKLIEKFTKISKQLTEVKDSKYESSASLLSALKKEDELILISNKISNYLSNSKSIDVVDKDINALIEKFDYISYQLSNEHGPELPRIYKHEKNIKKWIKNTEFNNYRKIFETIFEDKKHHLSKQIQEFRNIASRADISAAEPFSIITNSEMDFGYASTSKGKKIEINEGNRIDLLKSKDRMVRKTTSQNYAKGFIKHKESLANLLFQHFKSETVWAKLHKFDNVIDYLVYSDRSSEKLLSSLYESVENNSKLFKRISQVHKKSFKAKFGETMKSYDSLVPLVSVKAKYSIEEQQEMILNAFKPFGKEYISVIKEAFKNKWIDYMPVKNKRSGAYSIGSSFGINKYILMNNDGGFRSVETLAHELGHSLHSYFSDKNNHIRLSEYKIFVAEIASIFNELMLFDYVLNNTDDIKLKFKIRKQMAEGFEATVRRQVLFSNYEYDVLKAIEAGQPVSTYDALSKIYLKNIEKYSAKKNIKYKEEKLINSIRIPHYYYGFYVYKYAIGQLVANIFFQRYKEHGASSLQDYIKNFLSAGCTMTPLETLKFNGIDLEDPATYEDGFKPAYRNVVELEKLAKKIFKI